ncbi:MAG: hypothetical protein ISR69_11545 [Gammaproteobacteria bacterium]|nr:hypothetical protein [Gammaproteobacteria bacterium]
MEKGISTKPGAIIFRSTSVVAVAIVCIALFLHYSAEISNRSHLISKQTVLTDIKYSLSLMLYDFTIKGIQKELVKFDKENPLVALAIYKKMPNNYVGTKNQGDEIDQDHVWFFNSESHLLGYKEGDKVEYWQLQAIKEDGVTYLKLKAALLKKDNLPTDSNFYLNKVIN